MTTHPITIEIDDAKLAGYTDEFLAVCWHLAQHNPAEHGDYLAGELAERIGREIIRRWLRNVPPELWHHQGREHFRRELARFAKYGPTTSFCRLTAGAAAPYFENSSAITALKRKSSTPPPPNFSGRLNPIRPYLPAAM